VRIAAILIAGAAVLAALIGGGYVASRLIARSDAVVVPPTATPTAPPDRTPRPSPTPRTYKVRPGDTLVIPTP